MSAGGPGNGRKAPSYAWTIYLALASAAAIAYLFLSGGAQNILYVLIGLSMLAVILVGIRRHRPAPAWPWYVIAFGLSIFIAADMVFFVVYENVLGMPAPFPSIADALYLGSYAVTAVGLVSLVRPDPGREWGNLIDVGIVTACLSLIFWEILIEQYVEASSGPLLSTFVSLGYPIMGLLWLALAARLLFMSTGRTTSLYLLVGGLALHPLTDTIYGVLTLQGTYQSGTVVDLGWLLSYAFFGAAVLHPSMAETSERTVSSGQTRRVPAWTLALLAVAGLMPMAVFVIDVVRGDLTDIAVLMGAFVLFTLVIARVALLLRENERRAEEILRLNTTLEQRVQERTKQLEDQAATSQERAQLLDLTNDTIIFLDVESRVSFWNRGAEQMYGWTREEAEGKNVHELLQTRFPEPREEIFARLLREERWEGELIHVRRDGTSVTAASRWSLQRDDAGEPLRILEINNDVTERRKAEEELRKSEARARALAETSPDAILTMTTDGLIRSFNPAAERIFGYSAEEAIGCPLRQLMPERFRGAHEAGFRRYLAGAEARVIGKGAIEIAGLRKNGEEFPLDLSLGEMREEDDVLFTGIIRDVTERKEAREELERARETAESASRAKGDFLANMSHEIRTPMNGVIGMTGLLMYTDLTDEQREYAETIHRSGESLLTVINDILDFSKIEAGKLEIETIDFNLKGTVEETLKLFADRAHGKGLELAHLVAYDVPDALRGDPGRLTQVLNNLLGNAIKFTERGEVVLRVRMVEKVEERARVRFEVTDTGIGMNEEQRSRLFQSFNQADVSTTRRYGGTGLGLAISKQLVELMGGEIGLESRPGAGSTLWFEIPFEKQPGAVHPVPKPNEELKGLRVLVVDDNATNRGIIHQHVLLWGMRASTAEDAQSALSILRSAAKVEDPYNVVILDTHIPGIKTLDLAKEIESDPALSGISLMLLTSPGEVGEPLQTRETRAAAYLAKPVRPSYLYDAFATVTGTPNKADTEEEAALITLPTVLERGSRSQKRLLVAEDNAVDQMVATKMLESLGYRVDVASNGLEAVEELSRASYAAVLMDCHMPEMDGYEATREIRKREAETGRHIPIIALTASAMQEDREKALKAGMDDYVAKPVKREILGEALERWIPPRQAPDLPPESEGPADIETNADPLDRAAIEGLRELGGTEMLTELTSVFIDDARARLADLRRALQEGDDDSSVKRVSHALKGSSGNMGATRMAKICADLEDAGASGDLSGAHELLDILEAEFARVRPALVAEGESR